MNKSKLPGSKTRIIGLDPGIALLGYGIIDVEPFQTPELIGCGVITTSKNDSLPKRLQSIRSDVIELLNQFQPQEAGIELLYFTKNVKTAITVAQARGVVLEGLSSYGIESIAEFTPTHLKQVLFGHGKADKKQIQMIVSQILGLEGVIKPDDAADAVAIAIAYFRGTYMHKKKELI